MTTKPDIEHLIKNTSKTTKVIFGTISGMVATALVHPLDVIKVRLQINERSYTTREMARLIVRCEGARALYSGLTAGVMRQATYTTTRLTVYHLLNEQAKRKLNTTKSLNISDKVVIGVYAGLAGAFAGNPSEVALVRMMADGPRDPCSPYVPKKRYNGVLHAFYRIARDEGISALWRGGVLTLARSMFVSVAQIGTYAEVNKLVGDRKVLEGFSLHVFTSLVSSFVTTLLSLPIDLVKTRYQVRRDSMTQKDIFNDIIERKGALYLWKGIVPYFIRMAIHTVATLVIFENLTELYHELKK